MLKRPLASYSIESGYPVGDAELREKREKENALGPFFENLVDDVQSGVSSLRTAVRSAQAHVKESGANAYPHSLRIGRTTEKRTNASRDFMRAAGLVKTLETTLVDVKVRKLNYTNDFETVKVPILDPDRLVQYLITAGLSIPEEQVSEFWEKKMASGEEWVKSSPASTKHIPFFPTLASKVHQI